MPATKRSQVTNYGAAVDVLYQCASSYYSKMTDPERYADLEASKAEAAAHGVSIGTIAAIVKDAFMHSIAGGQ